MLLQFFNDSSCQKEKEHQIKQFYLCLNMCILAFVFCAILLLQCCNIYIYNFILHTLYFDLSLFDSVCMYILFSNLYNLKYC